jgi:hypothetical protein
MVTVMIYRRDIQETQMKYLSEWDQWKRYSSKSWKRFLEKTHEMMTHLELWRKDIRSIEGTGPARSPVWTRVHGRAWLGPAVTSVDMGAWEGLACSLLSLSRSVFLSAGKVTDFFCLSIWCRCLETLCSCVTALKF